MDHEYSNGNGNSSNMPSQKKIKNLNGPASNKNMQTLTPLKV